MFLVARSYLFLDFDGVLNSDAYFRRTSEARGDANIDPVAVGRLNDLVKRSGCSVIISSSWRVGRGLNELRRILLHRGFNFPERIIAKTPVLDDLIATDVSPPRGYEIGQWLEGHPRLPFAILDDDPDMDGLEDHFVKTNSAVGLTIENVRMCLLILSGSRKR